MKLLLQQVKKTFDKKEVLKDVSFTFEKGKIYGLLGRNGAGKTTLFNCMNGDLPTDGGSMLISDEENGQSERPITGDDIGYVLSTPVVPEFLTGREFLRFFLEINSKENHKLKTPEEYFELVKIAPDDRDKLLKDYSHGMKNKMQMLVNFIANPPVFLLDEPLTSFDVVVAEEMKQTLKDMKPEHITIFSTHIMELALDLCDEIIILNHGVVEKVSQYSEDGRSLMTEGEFKEKIIAALKEEEDA